MAGQLVMGSLNHHPGNYCTILKQHSWKALLQCFTKSFLECETIWLNIEQNGMLIWVRFPGTECILQEKVAN